MKQTDLCKLAKVPKSSLSLYLSGAYEPKQDRIYEMAKVLNVSEAWLMGYDVPMERQAPQQTFPDKVELSEKKKALIDFAMSVPEEKAEMILRVMKSILEAD
jgi:transcriptional regulator with XRE-family HTH domain